MPDRVVRVRRRSTVVIVLNASDLPTKTLILGTMAETMGMTPMTTTTSGDGCAVVTDTDDTGWVRGAADIGCVPEGSGTWNSSGDDTPPCRRRSA
jgi:hypothetical protein